jgi:DNA repair exonuclease SbcCD ATPase subunit
MALVNTLGMGMLLKYDVKGISEMRTAEQTLAKLKRQSESAFKAIEKQADKLRASMDRYKKGFKTSMKVAGTGVILAAPFAYATKEAIKFDDQMGKIRGLLVSKGLFGEDADKAAAEIGAAILAVGDSSRQTQELITAASYDVVSGLENWKAAGPVLQRAADLATSANGNMESSTESLLNTMNTFGVRWGNTMTPVEKADRIFTTLTNVVGQARTDINKLNGAMTYATPIANLMGQSFEGTAADGSGKSRSNEYDGLSQYL